MSAEQGLHIAHIVDLRVVGGIERILVEFILASPHIQHSLILFDKHVHPSHQQALHALPQIRGIYSAKHQLGLRLPKSMRVKRRARLIEQSGANVVLNWSQIVDMRQIHLPIVFYEHGSAWEYFPAQSLSACYQPVHHGIAVSIAAKRMLQLNHGFSAPCDVIENTAFKLPQVAMQPRSLPTGSILLGAAGRLVERKNFAVLIAAVAQLRAQYDVRLHIAGMGPEQARLQQQIDALGLQDAVTLMGYVSEMDAFYQSIDVFVNPSLWEAMPMVAIEAFAAGVPIIGTSTDGLPEKVHDGVNGICIQPRWTAAEFTDEMQQNAYFANEKSYDPLQDALVAQKSISVDDLVLAIEKMLTQPEQYQRMSAAALQTAGSVRTFAQWVEVLINSIEKARHV